MNDDEKTHWVFIDKKLLKNDPKNAVKIIGGITQLVKQNIFVKNRIVKYEWLQKKLKGKKMYADENYVIIKKPIERATRDQLNK